MAARRPQATAPAPAPHGARELLREAEALTGGAVAVFLVLALLSYVPDAPRANMGGAVGHALADTLLRALGVGAYFFPLYLAVVTLTLLRRGAEDLGAMRLAGAGVLVCGVAALAGLAFGPAPSALGGGWLGGFLAEVLREGVGVPGAVLLLGVAVVLATAAATGVSALAVARRGGGWLATEGRARLAAGGAAAWGALRARIARTPVEEEETAPVPVRRAARRSKGPIPLDDVIDVEAEEDDDAEMLPAPIRLTPIIREQPRKPEKREKRRRMEQEELFGDDSYRLPPLSLLDEPPATQLPIDEHALQTSARILESKLADFGVEGQVTAVLPGPVITTFEFAPAPGVRVARIVNLADDLRMALRAASVRILAPIPGKSVVGVEVSNATRQTVFIREMLESDVYRDAESKLTLALGKDTTGIPMVHDLAKMPHLLIAGATGTGKSVSMNAMILSVLFKASPRDCRMIMIDPKMLELSVYEHIPHLLVPVVTNHKKAAAALNNMVNEMEERYRLLHDKGVRNVDSYNRLIAQEAATAKLDEEEDTEGAEDGDDEEELAAAPPQRPGASPLQHRHLPRIVVIIDELADLMMLVGHEIEEPITRLAQKARAAGIHLILATQRPSVDVITGLIKANFPARISFQVTSGTNSRTILDCTGAERLLGNGDMLFLPPGTARVLRLHGPFVSDPEVHKVVDFIKRQEQPRYEMELLESPDDEEAEGGDEEDDVVDELYDKAVQLVTEHRQASISWVQRRLAVGYNRAARMIERMEREGVVSAPMGTKGREVIAQRIER